MVSWRHSCKISYLQKTNSLFFFRFLPKSHGHIIIIVAISIKFDSTYSLLYAVFLAIKGQENESVSVLPIRTQDLPNSMASNNLIACLVCGSMIDISDKKDQHVVKCNNCNEATVSQTTIFSSNFVISLPPNLMTNL